MNSNALILFNPAEGLGPEFIKIMHELWQRINTTTFPQTSLESGFYRCHMPEDVSVQRGQIQAADKAEEKDLREAGIICFDGINHVGQHLVKMPFLVRKLLQDKKMLPTTLPKVVVFNRQYKQLSDRYDALEEAYSWNFNKQHSSDEAKAVAEQLWKARFLNEAGELLPPEQVKKCCFLTYSFGNRMAAMVENALREKLREHKKDKTQISAYFNRFRRVCIASAPDVEGLVKAAAQPQIQTLHLIGQHDRGLAYPQAFFNRVIDFALQSDYITRDLACPDNLVLNQGFGGDGEGHRVIVFRNPQCIPNSLEVDALSYEDMDATKHGIKTYATMMHNLVDKELHQLVDMLLFSQSLDRSRIDIDSTNVGAVLKSDSIQSSPSAGSHPSIGGSSSNHAARM